MKPPESILAGGEKHLGGGGGDHRVSWQGLEVDVLQIGASFRQVCDHRSGHGYGVIERKGLERDGGNSGGKEEWEELNQCSPDCPQIESCQIWE